jgi:hypothetical protein
LKETQEEREQEPKTERYRELATKRLGDNKEKRGAECWWLTLVILSTQEAEIRRIMVQNQPGKIVCKTLS